MKVLEFVANKIRKFFECADCCPHEEAQPKPELQSIILTVGDQVVGAAQPPLGGSSDDECHLHMSRVRLSTDSLKVLFDRGQAIQKNQRVSFNVDNGVRQWKNCWIDSIAFTFTAGDWVILENVEVSAQYCVDSDRDV